MMIKAVFFDVNETVLDLSLLKEKFTKYLSDDQIVNYWFTKLLHTSNTIAILDEYVNFGELSAIVLENVFYEQGKTLTEEAKSDILGTFRKLSPYPDVKAALKILKDNDIKVIAVSNSSLEMMEEQLTNAGLIDLFDHYYSVDAVKKYKPFNQIYQYVAKKENISTDHVVMVASHDWDLFGAKKAGLKTAYIKRKAVIFNPIYPQPDFSEEELTSLVEKIVNND